MLYLNVAQDSVLVSIKDMVLIRVIFFLSRMTLSGADAPETPKPNRNELHEYEERSIGQ
jgi:hypothetical protein